MAVSIIKNLSHEEWLKMRAEGIGSSEVGTICGVNKYQNNCELWNRKLSERRGNISETTSNAAIMGHLLENAVAERWQIATGKEIIKSSAGDFIVKNDKRPYMQVSPDRFYWLYKTHSEKYKGILECKTTNTKFPGIDEVEEMDEMEECGGKTNSWMIVGDEKIVIPKVWYCQVQYQLATCERMHGSLAILKYGRDFEYVDITYDAEFCNSFMFPLLDEFWDCVINEREPENNDVDAKWAEATQGRFINGGPSTFEMIHKMSQNKAKIKELESENDIIEGQIKELMEDAEAIIHCDIPVVTWKNQKASRRFNAKRFELEHPDLYEQYMETGNPTRVFRISNRLKTMFE